MQVGTRVKYIRVDTEKDKATGYYPPVGTLGTVIEAHEEDIFVKWDSGTIGNGEWYCDITDVEEVEEHSELIDKIASFFEKEENWTALKNCWLEDDRSDDLRKLLQKALN